MRSTSDGSVAACRRCMNRWDNEGVHAGAPATAATADLDRLRIPLPEAELQARFEALQRQLIPQWELIEAFTDEPYTMVVVPSLSGVDLPLDSTKRQAYEERYLSLRLGIPMYGADPKFTAWGTKSGGRALFAEAGVPHPEGREGLRSRDDIIDAVLELVAARPGIESLVLKHDEGVAGYGNAVLDVRGLNGAVRATVEQRLSGLRPEDSHLSVERFLERLAGGGIVEELVVARELRSPSVQMRVTPLGKVEQLSTHDQLLGGASGLTFLGSVFPASDEYAREIAVEALKVGDALAGRGVIGRFAVDFLTARTDGDWKPYAIELNPP